MNDDRPDEWLYTLPAPAPPQNDHLYAFWTLRGATDRDITCSAYRVLTGIEMRVAYSEVEIIGTKLYRGVDADEQVARAADAVRPTMLEKGFREIAR